MSNGIPERVAALEAEVKTLKEAVEKADVTYGAGFFTVGDWEVQWGWKDKPENGELEIKFHHPFGDNPGVNTTCEWVGGQTYEATIKSVHPDKVVVHNGHWSSGGHKCLVRWVAIGARKR